MKPLEPPPKTKYNFLSLGAGVQSSTIALMIAKGEIEPMVDGAIFADTQAEPESVYKWLGWLTEQLPYPVHVVSAGNLTEESLRIRDNQKKPGKHWVKSLIPAHILNENGTKGILGRSCTVDYKLRPLTRKVRELAEIKRGQKEITNTQIIGISWDELQRMKESKNAWCQHRWPLIEMGMSRHHCLEWMKDNGYPEPPSSSCIYCPFHRDAEWRRLRDEEPEDFAKAIKFDHGLRKANQSNDSLKGKPYLHGSLKPLDEVDVSNDFDKGQMNLFINECEGLCGV